MTIDRLERVMWRLREKYPQREKITNAELRRAIMYECGTDPTTYYNNRKALKDLQWIRVYRKKHVIITNKDITGVEAK